MMRRLVSRMVTVCSVAVSLGARVTAQMRPWCDDPGQGASAPSPALVRRSAKREGGCGGGRGGGAACSCGSAEALGGSSTGLQARMRTEHERAHIVEIAERLLDARVHLTPIEPAETAAERRQRDRVYASCADFRDKGVQAGLDVRHPAVVAPMSFGRKIDDVFGVGDVAGLEHEHPSGSDS